MDFDGDIGLIQRKIADVPEGYTRRSVVFDSLEPKPGQAILDIGCGGGHLVQSFGRIVGSSGRAVGLDISEDQLSNARTLCEDAIATELVAGDATNMDFPDDSFDAVSSIQTMEYITGIDLALAEIKRVVKPGGTIALVSVLWDLFRFHGPDPELNQLMLDVWKNHCPHQMLPMEIIRKLETIGFENIEQKPIAFVNTELGENTYAYWAARAVAVFAKANGVDSDKVDTWLDQLSQSEKEGRFGFASVPVLTTAVAI
jgi:ubiquinone/menaquinone biosynthesis C-methylase UbiE